jgi:hypothetical protein
MAELISRSYYTELAKADPAHLCRHDRCRYLASEKTYLLKLWNHRYRIQCESQSIIQDGHNGEQLHEYSDLLAIYYLLQNKDVSPAGEWISEKDLPGGPTFFRGPHLLPTEQITKRFANDLEAFADQCEKLHGTPLPMADSAFQFAIAPDMPVAVLYWQGDEDFPAEAKILYDRTIGELLTLDIVFALAYTVCYRLGAQ